MTNQVPTPAHQAFREKRAEEWKWPLPDSISDTIGASRRSFLAGMEAEHEVAKLMGRIEALEEIQVDVDNKISSLMSGNISVLVRAYRSSLNNVICGVGEKYEAELAALLEGK